MNDLFVNLYYNGKLCFGNYEDGKLVELVKNFGFNTNSTNLNKKLGFTELPKNMYEVINAKKA